MCLAIFSPKGVQVSKDSLDKGFDNNPHGAGFAYAKGDKLHLHKGFFKFDEFWEAYEPFANQAAVIHFRWATHGNTDDKNCHPFEICEGQFAVVHNGVIDIDRSNDKQMSDTFHFSDLVLTPVLQKMEFDNPAVKYLIEEAIGSFNKLVLLRKDGKHVIYNEKKGEWHKGAWFSNGGYKTYTHRSKNSATTTTYYGKEYMGGKYVNGEWKQNQSRLLLPDKEAEESDSLAATGLGLEEKERGEGIGSYIPRKVISFDDAKSTQEEYQEAFQEYLEQNDATSAGEEQ